jgi:hypothetical protein
LFSSEQGYCEWDLRKWLDRGPSSAYPAISWGITALSSTPVQGRHMHSKGALVVTCAKT